MKKFMSLAVALVAAVVVSSSAFAASTQFTARASFAGEADFSFTLKNIQGDQTATDLTWAEADAFNMTETVSWVRALQYAEVVATITKANAKVLMFTENTVAFNGLIDKPNYNDGIVDNDHKAYGGLVRNNNGTLPSDFDGQYRGYIPVLFSVNTQKNAAITSDGSQVLNKDADDNPIRADRFLSEKANPSYSESYATIASLNGPTFGMNADGTVWGSGAVTNNTVYMYFFGGFANIIGGDAYSTTVKVQQSWE
ncbi:MAG: hypothetical protein J6U02_02415 [Elusimicrobia bacterium]|nr:hypothetical protein [Elusimicrobiota bacterium]